MAKTTYSELAILTRYVDDVTIFIRGIVKKDSVAIVLSCQVFMEHEKRQEEEPFKTEVNRQQWLYLRGRNLAMAYLKKYQREEQKERAIKEALHDCP